MPKRTPRTPEPPALDPLTVVPIGVVHSPFTERSTAPRQPYASEGALGSIELVRRRGFEHALEDLAGWEYLWVIFWFHRNRGWRPKVLPPRSTVRRGLFSTRTPHRPNPLGLSVVRLDRIDGLTLHIRNVDMLDGTPVLDLKPYVPWADAIPDASVGWFEAPHAPPTAVELRERTAARDPSEPYAVRFDERATEQLAFLADGFGIDLAAALAQALALGPHPHPYRRIKPAGADAFVVAHKSWRARFRVRERTLQVYEVFTGYRPDALGDTDPALDAHRAFVARWGRADATR